LSADYLKSVEADIARRYGVPVQSGAVQLVARGVSGIELPVWSEEKNQLIFPDFKARLKRAMSSAYKRAMVNPVVFERRAKVLALHGAGHTDREIAAALDIEVRTVVMDRKYLGGLAPNSGPVQMVEAETRWLRIGFLAAQGWTDAAIAADVGISVDTIHRKSRKVLGIAVLRAPTAPKLRKNAKQPKVRSTQISAKHEAAKARRLVLQGLIDAGVVQADLAVRLGVTVKTVQRDVRALGLVWVPPVSAFEAARIAAGHAQTRPEEVAARYGEVRRMAALGLTREQMRARLDIPMQMLNRYIRQTGVKVPPAVRVRAPRVGPSPAMQARRMRVADMRAKGWDTKRIARVLGISARTLGEDEKAIRAADLDRSAQQVAA